MQEIFDYFSGELDTKSFLKLAKNDSHVAQWFQGLLPPGAEIIDIPWIPHQFVDGQYIGQAPKSSHPFWNSVSTGYYFYKMKDKVDFAQFFQTMDAAKNPGDRLNLYCFLTTIAETKFNGFQKTDRYSKEHSFYLDVCGECYESKETAEFIDSIVLPIFYSSGTLVAKRKLAKERLKEAFHVEGNHKPCWIHGSLWPMGKNSPMKYISAKKDRERREYLFRDVDTLEERVIEDYF